MRAFSLRCQARAAIRHDRLGNIMREVSNRIRICKVANNFPRQKARSAMCMLYSYLGSLGSAAHFASLLLETVAISRFQAIFSASQPLVAVIRAPALAVFRSLPRELARFARSNTLGNAFAGNPSPPSQAASRDCGTRGGKFFDMQVLHSALVRVSERK